MTTRLIASTALALCLAASAAAARPAVVALAPAASPEMRRDIAERTAFYLARTVEPGESAELLDASTGDVLATFSVPDRAVYAAERAKLKANPTAMRALKVYMSTDPMPDVHEGAIDLPGLLRAIGERYPADTTTDLVIWGSPVHHDPRMPAFSMQDARVPGDGHFARSRAETPYAAAGESGRLANYRLHFGRLGDDPAVNEAHGYFLEQYLGKSVAARGGVLVSYESDPKTLYRIASGSVTAPTNHYVVERTDKLEMMAFGTSAPAVTPERSRPIHERSVTDARPDLAHLVVADAVEIGITWNASCGCDVDLYAKPLGGQTIYHRRPETDEGKLYKDFTSSPETDNGLERIGFLRSIDLRALRLAINLYGGIPGAAGVHGEIRIAIGDRTWAMPFEIAAAHASYGVGAAETMRTGTPENDAWVVIDPLEVLGLR